MKFPSLPYLALVDLRPFRLGRSRPLSHRLRHHLCRHSPSTLLTSKEAAVTTVRTNEQVCPHHSRVLHVTPAWRRNFARLRSVTKKALSRYRVFQPPAIRVTVVTCRMNEAARQCPSQFGADQGPAQDSEIPASASASTPTSIVDAVASSRAAAARPRAARVPNRAHPSLRRVADQDDVEPVGRRTARRDRIGRALEPHRLVSQRRQHLLVSQQPIQFALDDQHRLAAPERQHRRANPRGAVRASQREPGLETASVPLVCSARSSLRHGHE